MSAVALLAATTLLAAGSDGDWILVGGEALRIAYFSTGAPLDAVAQEHAQRWSSEGRLVISGGVRDKELLISSFATRTGEYLGVLLRRSGEKTIDFSIAKDLWREPALRSRLAPTAISE